MNNRDSADLELPSRVRRAITVAQDAGERTVAWARLILAVTFVALFIASLGAAGMEQLGYAMEGFEAVVLTGYVVFALFYLAVARRGSVPGWLLIGSIVVDVALLMGLIWSFHLKYDQPEAFYLKAPTLLYVFIFIAMRALRFEPRYVLFTGLAAALGWLILVLLAVAEGIQDPTMIDGVLTRDYVTYMSQPLVLIGAEIDKVVSILVVAALLAVAVQRARGLMQVAHKETMAASDLRRFFPADVAARITDRDEAIRAGEGEMREATILNVDLRGFTRLSKEMPPDNVIAFLADYQKRVVPLIREHNGAVDKFLGDGIMATFGAARVTGTHCADSIRCGLALLANMDAWTAERAAQGLDTPALGLSVATGSVIFGAVGDGKRLEYTVIGDAVNLSAKLEKHNKAENARFIGDATTHTKAIEQGLEAAVPAEARAQRPVEGVAHPLDIVVYDHQPS